MAESRNEASAPPNGHTRIARVLHWAVALLLPFQAGLGWLGERAVDPEQAQRLLQTHFSLGVAVFALVVARTVRRIFGRHPSPPANLEAWQRGLASLVHTSLYLLLWMLLVSGYVIWVWMSAPMDVFGAFELPSAFTPPVDDERGRALAWYVHVYGAWVLGALVMLHVAAVAWHGWVRRDGLPARMGWPRRWSATVRAELRPEGKDRYG